MRDLILSFLFGGVLTTSFYSMFVTSETREIHEAVPVSSSQNVDEVQLQENGSAKAGRSPTSSLPVVEVSPGADDLLRRILFLLGQIRDEENLRESAIAKSGTHRFSTSWDYLRSPGISLIYKNMQKEISNFIEASDVRYDKSRGLLFEADIEHLGAKFKILQYVPAQFFFNSPLNLQEIRTVIRSGDHQVFIELKDTANFGALDSGEQFAFLLNFGKCEYPIAMKLNVLKIDAPDRKMRSKISVFDYDRINLVTVGFGDWRRVDFDTVEKEMPESDNMNYCYL